MRSPPFHPDQLVPDSEVGPWRILESLGSGGFGRVFKVERAGRSYSLKMALRPAGQHTPEEEDINGRLAHEVAALLACAPHPNLPALHAVDRWPEPPDGYLYFVTDYIDGETFHEWRWRVKPTAAHLLSVFTEVVRVVADMHRRGVHHRDIKGDNLLIRREDERPFLIDLGTVRLPGATTLTVGVAPASPHLLPPECVAFLREGSWQQGANFDAGVPGDLYALGALLYEALTDGYAFDPKLPYDRLLPAIETVTPRAPHVVNPKVPRALGDIALRLLAKRPEDRYASAEALLQALWDVAKEKRQPAWKVSLDRPPEGAGDAEAPRVRMVPDAPVTTSEQRPRGEGLMGIAPVLPLNPEPREVPVPEAPASAAATPPAPAAPEVLVKSSADAPADPLPPPPAPKRRRGVVGRGVAAVLAVGLVAFGLSRLVSPSEVDPATAPSLPIEKGSPAVTSRSSNSSETPSPEVVPSLTDAGAEVQDAGEQAAALASAEAGGEGEAETEAAPRPKKRPSSTSALGKAAAVACLTAACAGGPQVRDAPPQRKCPPEVLAGMAEIGLFPPKMMGNDETVAMVPSVRLWKPVPVPPDGGPLILYAHNNVTSAHVRIFPEGTRLHGTVFRGRTAIYGWITEAEFPDGRRMAVCGNIVNNPSREELGTPYDESSTPGNPMMPPGVNLAASQVLGKLGTR
ncbi:serine/threonine protein kinase [Myxococcus hansupus]|uniref:non-specific serine/threonine protein kinase n=1 Tax=Pseudomyxococcus hansupus TaxID=1297742 RepID=A0A0H4WY44_9BACT|nr:serine/threonine-protein kinase [Myxococcus hansupus]AKQ67729.1 serine/threonine protein kinase [Myxococcus hansupus]